MMKQKLILIGLFIVSVVVVAWAQFDRDEPGFGTEVWMLDPRTWFDGRTDAGSLEQETGTHFKTYDLQIENSARIKNVTDESTLETPEAGYALLYTYWDGSTLKLRVLLSNNQIAECRILDTSTAVDCKPVWAVAYPDRYIFAPRDENGINYLISTRQG